MDEKLIFNWILILLQEQYQIESRIEITETDTRLEIDVVFSRDRFDMKPIWNVIHESQSRKSNLDAFDESKIYRELIMWTYYIGIESGSDKLTKLNEDSNRL